MQAHVKDLPVTPDRRYFVVRGRLWRMSNPNLDQSTKKRLVSELMSARRDVGAALRHGDKSAERAARGRVNAAKIALGERGKPWWNAAEGDFNQRLVATTPYADWYADIPQTRH